MDWTAIGTVIGSLATAAIVFVYLKPYKRKIIYVFGMQEDEDGKEYSIRCFNDVKNIYCSYISLLYIKK